MTINHIRPSRHTTGARVDEYTITDQTREFGSGFTAHAADLATALCQAVGGRRWRARASYSVTGDHTAAVEQTWVAVTIDDQLQVTLTHTTPAYDDRPRWTLAVDGQPVPHRAYPQEKPGDPHAVSRSLHWHLHEIPHDPCDAIGCDQPATIATWYGGFCPDDAP